MQTESPPPSFVLGCIICFISRNDESVVSDTLYITIGQVNFLEIVLVGLPINILNKDDPTKRFVVSLACVFIAFGGLVLIIFVPKFIEVMWGADDGQMTISVSFKKNLKSSVHGDIDTFTDSASSENSHRVAVELGNLSGASGKDENRSLSSVENDFVENPIVR